MPALNLGDFERELYGLGWVDGFERRSPHRQITGAKRMQCKIKRQDEQFVVQVSEDKKTTTVTDERGTVVTISWNSGNYDVRLPNGWGSWSTTMDAAVERAVRLCLEARSQHTADKAAEEMVAYVKNCQESE